MQYWDINRAFESGIPQWEEMREVSINTIYSQILSAMPRPIEEFTEQSKVRITNATWGPLNQTIITSTEDGRVRIIDRRVNYLILKLEPQEWANS